ncbi:hypothetical protein [Kitasatospora sp. NPDC057015]|uniref:hypothetical protein n=1 Tax=Kitasatospora sp. NPDC057015 TaxID=3346001 RepID=UPI00363CE4D6
MGKPTDDPDDGGSGGGVKITENYLAEFADQKLKGLIDDLDTSEALARIMLYSAGGDGKSAKSRLLAGTSVDGYPSPTSLVAGLGTYTGGLQTYIKGLSSQVSLMREDLKHADWVQTEGNDNALTAAQLMWLIDDVLKGGGSAPGGA